MNLDNEYQLLKVFDELYVGLKEQGTGVNLGFATPVENNKAFEKRKSTVDRWARPYGKRVQKEDGEWEWVDGTPIPAITVKNDAVSGFKVADDVRRTYWGGGNVVWRIYDPRGYELEISSANLIRIIDSVGINAGGEIPVKCKWARLGANNILVPEGSDLWGKCIKDAETIKERSTTTSGFSAGDVVILDSQFSVKTVEGIRCPTFTEPVMLKPSKGRQAKWLTMELLHAAPEAEFVSVGGKPGAQLTHPKGGPLGWVECPYENVKGVVRYKDAWHWVF